jgi:hypothetical protein
MMVEMAPKMAAAPAIFVEGVIGPIYHPTKGGAKQASRRETSIEIRCIVPVLIQLRPLQHRG